MTAPFLGPDGAPRCPWSTAAPEFLAYHDTEWGSPVADATGRRREEIARIVVSMSAHQRAGLIDALHAFAEAAGEPSAPARQLGLVGW
ncbi:hypothetical protein [Kitasatospora sp. NPDC091207]|uniref:hypothetical protein n=1 Tax=Kitasatospora sp. NPDC091207 TaxID=3364083 RepID=UPI0037FFD817